MDLKTFSNLNKIMKKDMNRTVVFNQKSHLNLFGNKKLRSMNVKSFTVLNHNVSKNFQKKFLTGKNFLNDQTFSDKKKSLEEEVYGFNDVKCDKKIFSSFRLGKSKKGNSRKKNKRKIDVTTEFTIHSLHPTEKSKR